MLNWTLSLPVRLGTLRREVHQGDLGEGEIFAHHPRKPWPTLSKPHSAHLWNKALSTAQTSLERRKTTGWLSSSHEFINNVDQDLDVSEPVMFQGTVWSSTSPGEETTTVSLPGTR